MKLLLIDDDADIRRLLSAILTKSGYSVRSASDGFSALAAIRESMPEILLSDLFMPGMSGFEFLSVVRRRFPLLPVIAMSSAYAGEAVPDGVAADAFYEKATDLQALLGMVNGLHERPQTGADRKRRPAVPIWVARSGEGREKRTKVTLACPQCLRTFSETIRTSKDNKIICEAGCLHCSLPMSYALVGVDAAAKPVRQETRRSTAKTTAVAA